MIAAAGSSSSSLSLVAAFLGAFAGFLAVAVATYPFWRRHREDSQRRNERLDDTADAVLGVPADPDSGRYSAKPGLVHVVPLNGYGLPGVDTVLGKVEEVRKIAVSAESQVEAIRRRDG